MDNDLQGIQQTVRQLYACISFTTDYPPNWTGLSRLFLGDGQLVRNLEGGPEHFTLSAFREWVEKARQAGLASFHEEETDSSTHLMGSLAHRASHYRATVGGPQGGSVDGINSVQLMKVEDEWKVVSLAWAVPKA